jgi:hypothetical protein
VSTQAPLPAYRVTVFSAEEETAGELAWQTFTDAMRDWMPLPPSWSQLSVHVRNGWIAVAKRLRSS